MELGYGGDKMPTVDCGRDVMPTIEQRLSRRKESLERDLASVNDALNALKENPEVAKVISLISKVNY